MASPQAENGHIDIANTIADKLCSYRLSGQEWQIIWVILRKTWGWLKDPKNKYGDKKKMDRIALSQFEQLTGIDRRKCHTLLKKLTDKKVIKRCVTQKGDRIVITYGFQKNYDLWKLSPKKVTVTQKGVKPVTQKGTHKRYIKDNKDILAYISTDIISFSQDFIDYTKTEKGSLAPNGKNLLKNSADTIDKIIRLDDFSFEYIGVVIKWAVKDDFWSNNILSLHGLRKKSGNGLTKFQNIANGYEKSKIMVIPKNNRLNQNKEACKSFVEGAGDER
ncbi:MAG: hypothetical protein HOG03_24340 [Desulfobacula sp.]|jgi:phage replication O-like protein O|uniref:replication protein n=1 Tax=Desulfobacula sp. TaxID=2593537 RepID=UPI001ED727A4|nr:hypothetical protein [Desulfobacula sp.]